ncbi:MAG: DegQ family serine endoprotease [Proteobacteria bacterium]|nr:DegQ family serine endoprotease [Pseudomonadota bacterium]
MTMQSDIRGRARGMVLTALAAASLAAVGTGVLMQPQAQAQPQPAAVAPAVAAPVTGLPDFTGLVAATSPAVVNIRTTERLRGAARGIPGMDPGLQEFFRRFGIPLPGSRDGAPGNNDDEDGPQRRGVGSGFLISADGYIMTNAHVVDGADELLVTMTDKREFKAKVVGADKRTDVAIVKIEATGLPHLKAGDVGHLRVGEWVLAIGSPFNLANTVTAGIVSAMQRDTGDFLPFIQTDVAVNPGNSGGPLLNMRGEVVGINSQIYSPSGAFAGISFAIPIDEATRVADQLRSGGRVIRGRIGVGIGAVSDDVAEALKLGKAQGAVVQSVEPDTPADKAGLEVGDVIVKVDGRTVDKPGDLSRMIAATKPGTPVTLDIWRRGAPKSIKLTVAQAPDDRQAAEQAAPVPAAQSPLGLAVADLTAAQRRDLKIKGGVQVREASGAAARAGLREDDVILQIDNQEVTTAAQFNTLVSKLDSKRPVSVLVRRGDWVNYLVIRPTR